MAETILQFGAGRFLRAFVDRFVQHANDAGQEVGQVVVVQSTPGQRADLLNRQPEGFQVLVRGIDGGERVEKVERVRSIRRALLAGEQWSTILEIARSPDLRYLVSNATEAGYRLEDSDRPEDRPPASLPAKLARVLWERFKARPEPVVLLPCELIEQNATRLLELVLAQARKWDLPEAFMEWTQRECAWLNNLVDCIVTSPPADHPLAREDALLVCAEPFAFWAIERPRRSDLLFDHPAIALVDDLTPYYLRKVRILNGLHTAMVAKFLPKGYQTVMQVMEDREALGWVKAVLWEEIVPTIAHRVNDLASFAETTLDRLRNPFLDHRLCDISLNHQSKVKVRLVPTVEEYRKLFSQPPRRLSELI